MVCDSSTFPAEVSVARTGSDLVLTSLDVLLSQLEYSIVYQQAHPHFAFHTAKRYTIYWLSHNKYWLSFTMIIYIILYAVYHEKKRFFKMTFTYFMYMIFRVDTFIFSRGVTIHLPHDTIRIVMCNVWFIFPSFKHKMSQNKPI